MKVFIDRVLLHLSVFCLLNLHIPIVNGASSEGKMTEDAFLKKIEGWRTSSGANGIKPEVWKNAMISFFRSDYAIKKCTLAIANSTNPSTSNLWVGNFSGGKANTILYRTAALGDGKTPGHTSRTPNTSKWLPGCKLGNAMDEKYISYRKTDLADIANKTVRKGSGHVSILQKRIIWGIPFAGKLGAIQFHDGYLCSAGRSTCTTSWGCLVIPPLQMRQLCANHLGGDHTVGKTSPKLQLYLYIYNQYAKGSMIKGGSAAAAARNFNRVMNGACKSASTKVIDNSGSGISLNDIEGNFSDDNYGSKVTSARNGTTGNMSFAPLLLIAGLGLGAYMIYGGGDRKDKAEAANEVANLQKARAKTDPRPLAAIKHAGTMTPEELAEANKKLQEQGANQDQRYAKAQILDPVTGDLIKTNDNHDAFKAAVDNTKLARSEAALYRADLSDAKEDFKASTVAYSQSLAKQKEAGQYQVQGLNRSVLTATKFRDFYNFKEKITRYNLRKMPTRDSLIANCHKNTPANEDVYTTYNYLVEPIQKDYQFPRLQISRDFCQEHVDYNIDTLVKNRHIRDKLRKIANDSKKMSSGLNNIISTLQNRGLSVSEKSKFLSQNLTWQALGERKKSLDECNKTRCLEEAAKLYLPLIDYPRSENDKSNTDRSIDRITGEMIRTGRLPAGLRGEGNNPRNLKNLFNKEDLNNLKNATASQRRNKRKNNPSLKEETTSINQGQLTGDLSKQINGKNSSLQYESYANLSSGQYYRDQDGVLRNAKTGKAVSEYLSPESLDIFKIISHRYQKKFLEIKN